VLTHTKADAQQIVPKDSFGPMAEVAILVSVSTRCLKEPG